MDEAEKALWDVYDILTRAGWGGEPVTRDRYLNADDPRDPPAEAQALPPGGARGTAAPVSGLGGGEPTSAGAPDDQFPVPSSIGKEQGTGAAQPAPAPPPESETDRCLRVMREVFLGQPGPHDLPSGVAEVERRLKGDGK